MPTAIYRYIIIKYVSALALNIIYYFNIWNSEVVNINII